MGFKIKRRTRILDKLFFKKYEFKRDCAISYSTGKLICNKIDWGKVVGRAWRSVSKSSYILVDLDLDGATAGSPLSNRASKAVIRLR